MVAPTMVDVIRFAGGWLFDRAMAGWDVTAVVTDHTDARPLHIIGARAVDLEAAMATTVRSPLPQSIAVDVDLYSSDRRVRNGVLEVLDRGKAGEVTLWGEGCPKELDYRVGAVEHRLSVAARAFKAQALRAAAAPAEVVGATEMFRSCELLHGLSPDLVPAG
ncbi:hypothetical protein GCM10023318_24440 [Nocardia callitridis]|uniref:Uncharacterized protein n=1 Tax=Nocardia callitridis TaxID=648753 RepID=A0ABP9K9D7_9NOCA